MHAKTLMVLLIVLAAAGLLAGCGQSEEEKATDQVCIARDDIAKQVDQLKGLTLTTATTDQVQNNVQAIRDDLAKIADARANLSDNQRTQVEQANDAFRSEMGNIAATVARSTSIEEASAQLKAAFNDLAATYNKTFGQIDCS
jgi:phosphoglycerate-specific signal transduction histidine kinase